MHQMKFAPRVLLALLLAVMSTQRAGAQPGVTVFHGARVIVGDGRAIENAAFIVDGGRFAWVGILGDAKIPPTAASVDLKGKTVIPAIIDTHTHLNRERGPLVLDLQRRAYYGVG